MNDDAKEKKVVNKNKGENACLPNILTENSYFQTNVVKFND